MFTGIISHNGKVVSLQQHGASRLLEVSVPLTLFRNLKAGRSIAVNGVCVSVLAKHGVSLTFDVMPETLRVTNLGMLKKGAVVNLEKPLRMGDPLGGHLVQGHVEGVGTIVSLGEVWTVRLPRALMRSILPKGSIALEGVSLTVVKKLKTGIQISLLSDTLKRTSLRDKAVGDTLNVETDMLTKL